MIGLSIRRLLREPFLSGVKPEADSISGGMWYLTKSNDPTFTAVGSAVVTPRRDLGETSGKQFR